MAYVPVKLSYKTFEPTTGSNPNLSPVIFMHGLTALKENWEDIPQYIADKTKRTTITYDARNHGDSEYCDEFSFDLNIDDLLHFLDSMKIQKAILVGHSMGGITATHTALRNPDRVEMVFAEDISVKKIPRQSFEPLIPFIALRAESVKNIPKELNEAEAKKFSTDYMYNRIPESSPLYHNRDDLYKASVFLKQTEEGYALKFNVNIIIRALSSETLMKDPEGVYSGPAYFLYGNKSPLNVKSEEDNIKEHFPKAELIEFDGATHNVHLDCPELFKNTLVKCIQG